MGRAFVLACTLCPICRGIPASGTGWDISFYHYLYTACPEETLKSALGSLNQQIPQVTQVAVPVDVSKQLKCFHVVLAGHLPHLAREFQFEQRGKNLGRGKFAFQFFDQLVQLRTDIRLQDLQQLFLVRR